MAAKRRGRPPAPTVTAGQERTLQALRELLASRSFPPTIQELGERLGLTRATVHEHVTALVEKGYVRREPRTARALIVVRRPPDRVRRPPDESEAMVAVPLVGMVAAGQPLLAEENRLGEVLVEARLAERGPLFALRTTGDSMIGAGIRDGDVVIVRRQPIAESGEIVVALLEDEATVKRLRIQGDRIELRAENRRYRPIVVGPETELRILGKVIAIRSSPGA